MFGRFCDHACTVKLQLRMSRGGGKADPALSAYVETLEKIQDVTVGVCTVSAYPLATTRPRCLLYVSRDPNATGPDLAKECEGLAEIVATGMDRHHLSAFLDAANSTEQCGAEDDRNHGDSVEINRAQELKVYHEALAKALEKAVARKRLSNNDQLPAMAKRPSETHASLARKSAWCKAQADVYFLIGQAEAQQRGMQARGSPK